MRPAHAGAPARPRRNRIPERVDLLAGMGLGGACLRVRPRTGGAVLAEDPTIAPLSVGGGCG
ncbi:hypothetical protein B7486_62595 [cyanobacterium TDX16]|nr:hypothetical protein B7486_62595 [cyanobacterium TDX16]